MSTGKIELSVGAVKVADKYEILTEEEVDNINNKIPELDKRVGVIEDEIEEINSSLDNMENKNTVINLRSIGVVSENVDYDVINKRYNMTDISNIINNLINKGYDTIIFPSGNFLIDDVVIVNKPIQIIGNKTNIYSSPSILSHNIFTITSSNCSINGINFYSEREYENNVQESTATSLTSNACAINILGGVDDKNINISNCYFENTTFAISVQQTKNVTIENITCKECYFCVYTGLNAENIVIKNSILECQKDTDIYGHVLYFAHTSKNILVDNCNLISNDVNSSNIVKCGSNTGGSSNIIVRNTTMNITTNTSVFYIHEGADLSLYDCKVFSNSPNGYARLFQINDNTKFKCVNSELTLDSFDKYTQRFGLNNCSIIFENSTLTTKNSYNVYCNLPFVSGSDEFVFKGCTINIDSDRPINLLTMEQRTLTLDYCILNLNATKIACGYYNASDISYTKTDSPELKIYNTIIKNNSGVEMGASSFFMNIVKDDTTKPICHLSNVTLYKCSGTSGGNLNKLFMPNAESQYIKNNVIDLTP